MAGTLKLNHPNTFIARITTTDGKVADNGEVTFVTPGNDIYGHVNAQLNQKITNIVNLDGSQTITGIKTFGALEGTSNIAIILPGADKIYDIGSSAKRFNVVYADRFDGRLEGIASNADK